MGSIPKTKKIEMLQKALHRRYKWQSDLPERSVLEHLVYSALLEDAPVESASTAYEILESYFIDWNEVRVTTTPELAEIISVLPDAITAAERVRKALRGVFDKTYMFDLEDLRKKGKSLSQAVAFLKSLGTLSPFMIDYVTQFALGGHIIPLDESARRVFRMLDLTQVNKERTEEYVPGIERAVPKKNGILFTMELHNFAYLLRSTLDSNKNAGEYLSVLKNIDSQAPTRDYTPPALTIPKPKPKERIIAPIPVNIPFGVSDDEDFDEDHNGTEAEFIPNELNSTPNDLLTYYDNAQNKIKTKDKKESPQDKSQSKKNKSTNVAAAMSTEQYSTPKIEPDKIVDKNSKQRIKTVELSDKNATKKIADITKTTPIPQKNNKTNKIAKPSKNAAVNSVSSSGHAKQLPQSTQKDITTKNSLFQNKIKKKDRKQEAKKILSVKSQKKELQKNIKSTNTKFDKSKSASAVKHDKHDAAQTGKRSNDKKQQSNKSIEKPNKKQNDKKVKNNNSRKIINVVSKGNKSVTKRLQQKRPK